MVLKVVAIPNDQFRIDKSAIYIIDVQVTGFSPDFVARVVGPGACAADSPRGTLFRDGRATDQSEHQ
jgi:hypothetical protein